MERDKKIVIVITIIVSIIIVCGISKVLLANKEDKEIIKEVKKDKTFAIMIQSGDTYKEYTSKDNKWPDDNYIFSKAECVDNAGNRIEDAITFNNETRKATLKSKKTIYCTLYFDESNIIKLRENDPQNKLSSEIVGGMYRYQGLYTDDIRNYICLGEYCCKTEECNADTNDYMYRIIGITPDGELKVIKKTALTNALRWYSTNKTDIEWPDSELFHRLNDYEEGAYKDTSFYNGLNQNLKSLIVKKEWLYGKISEMKWNSSEIYNMETGKLSAPYHKKNTNDENYITEYYLWNESISAYIGLQYIHDYMFAYPGGNPENSTNALNSWIHLSHNEKNHPSNSIFDGSEYLLSKLGYFNNGNYNAWYISSNGDVPWNGGYNELQAIRPVFYISSSIKLTGDGTLTNPFKVLK